MTDTRYSVTVTPRSATESRYTAYFDHRAEADQYAEDAVHKANALTATVTVAGYTTPLKIVTRKAGTQ